MADRERSRSPDPPAQDQAPENGNAAPVDNGNGAVTNGAPAAADGEGVKLYVGNLDYGTYSLHEYAVAQLSIY